MAAVVPQVLAARAVLLVGQVVVRMRLLTAAVAAAVVLVATALHPLQSLAVTAV